MTEQDHQIPEPLDLDRSLIRKQLAFAFLNAESVVLTQDGTAIEGEVQEARSEASRISEEINTIVSDETAEEEIIVDFGDSPRPTNTVWVENPAHFPFLVSEAYRMLGVKGNKLRTVVATEVDHEMSHAIPGQKIEGLLIHFNVKFYKAKDRIFVQCGLDLRGNCPLPVYKAILEGPGKTNLSPAEKLYHDSLQSRM